MGIEGLSSIQSMTLSSAPGSPTARRRTFVEEARQVAAALLPPPVPDARVRSSSATRTPLLPAKALSRAEPWLEPATPKRTSAGGLLSLLQATTSKQKEADSPMSNRNASEDLTEWKSGVFSSFDEGASPFGRRSNGFKGLPSRASMPDLKSVDESPFSNTRSAALLSPLSDFMMSEPETPPSKESKAGIIDHPATPNSTASMGTPSQSPSLKLPRNFSDSSLDKRSCSPTLKGSRSAAHRRLRASLLQAEAELAKKALIRQLEEGQKIFDLFHWEEVLQESGDGGKVVICRAKDAETSEFDLVMKIRSKDSLAKAQHGEAYRKTYEHLLSMEPHRGIIMPRQMLEDDRFFYVIMDKAKGGSLFGSLLEDYSDGAMPHGAIKELIRDILEAVAYIHQQGLLHRDLKPDNLVMQVHECPETGRKLKKVAIIDFDHADPDGAASENVGTTCYGTLRFNPPEAFLGCYSATSDLYSVGAIMYLLMTGKLPYADALFDGSPPREASPKTNNNFLTRVYRQLSEASVDWSCDPWPADAAASSFCQSMLAFNPSERFSSAQEALAHPWLIG